MISFIKASIFDVGAQVIAHQANCHNTMGGGVALQIAKRWPEVAKDEATTMSGKIKLGAVHFSKPLSGPPLIAHLYGQDHYGSDKQQTDYEALRMAIGDMKDALDGIAHHNAKVYDFSWVKAMNYNRKLIGKWNENELLAESNGPIHIAIPSKIGCGLAGGDWDIVKQILIDEFEKVPLFRVSVCSID